MSGSPFVVLDTNVVLYHLSDRLKQPLQKRRYAISIITEIELLSYPKIELEETTKIKNFVDEVTIGRLYEHWHTMTRTGRIEKIMKKQPQPFIEIHPQDAAKLNIEEEMMVEVRSRRGIGRFAARVTAAIAPGTVFVPMHWGALWGKDTEANTLTHPEACPISLQPELKACAVNLISVEAAESEVISVTQDTDRGFIRESLKVV